MKLHIPNMMHTTGVLVALGCAILVPATAMAGAPVPTQFEVSSRVDTVVGASPTMGLTRFNYEITNTSTEEFVVFTTLLETDEIVIPRGRPFIVDWEIPYFADAGIANIMSPTGWAHEIETVGMSNAATGWNGVASWQDPTDPFYPGDGSPFLGTNQVLHWYLIGWAMSGDLTGALDLDESLAGFSIDSPFSTPADAPYQASWDFLEVISGDPPFPLGLPGSPSLIPVAVPEPGILALFGVGLIGVAMVRRRRKA